ncbi:MAG: LON peptidase substrate-binding domain-containing protein [Caulobacterales bacterium]
MPGGVYRKIGDLPSTIPIFPLSGAVVFPHGALPLNIFEPRYLNMVDDAMCGQRIIGMIQPVGPGENEEHPHVVDIGCAARITSYSETDDGRYLITLTGICRFRVAQELEVMTPYRQVLPDFKPYKSDLDSQGDSLLMEKPSLLEALSDYLVRTGLGAMSSGLQSAPVESLINTLAAACPFEPAEKQALLEAPGLAERAGLLKALFETSGRTRLM